MDDQIRDASKIVIGEKYFPSVGSGSLKQDKSALPNILNFRYVRGAAAGNDYTETGVINFSVPYECYVKKITASLVCYNTALYKAIGFYSLTFQNGFKAQNSFAAAPTFGVGLGSADSALRFVGNDNNQVDVSPYNLFLSPSTTVRVDLQVNPVTAFPGGDTLDLQLTIYTEKK